MVQLIMVSITLTNLIDRIKKLESEVELQRNLINSQQQEIQRLNLFLVSNNNSPSSVSIDVSKLSSVNIGNSKNGLSEKQSKPVLANNQRDYSNYDVSNSKTNSKSSTKGISALPLSLKRQRAIESTKKLIASLPTFGLKNITVPSSSSSVSNNDMVTNQGSSKKRRILSKSDVRTAFPNKLDDISTPALSKPSLTSLNVETVEKINNQVRIDKRYPKFEYNLTMLKPIHHFDERLRTLKALLKYINERGTFQIQELLNDGGRELFILWLRDELESVTHAANHSIELIFELVQLLEYASWSEELVSHSRYDKLLRRIYKKCLHECSGAAKESLLDLLKRIWPTYRSMQLKSSNANGSIGEDED